MPTEIWNPDKVTERREGVEAAAFARSLLMEATGADDITTAKEMVMGRPPIGHQSEPSVAVQFRVPKSWKPQIDQDAAKQGMTVSEYMRSLVSARHRELQAA